MPQAHTPTPIPQDPAPAARGPRGGRRAGAGAPKGNLNALKHAAFSDDAIIASAIMAVFPEVGRFYDTVIKSQSRTQQNGYRRYLSGAIRELRGRPYLTETIKRQILVRLQKAASQIRDDLDERQKNANTIRQSNAPDAPAQSSNPGARPHPETLHQQQLHPLPCEGEGI